MAQAADTTESSKAKERESRLLRDVQRVVEDMIRCEHVSLADIRADVVYDRLDVVDVYGRDVCDYSKRSVKTALAAVKIAFQQTPPECLRA